MTRSVVGEMTTRTLPCVLTDTEVEHRASELALTIEKYKVAEEAEKERAARH